VKVIIRALPMDTFVALPAGQTMGSGGAGDARRTTLPDEVGREALSKRYRIVMIGFQYRGCFFLICKVVNGSFL
jgi:hypothetical protein